jgi:AmmeMemoRadiSam system protein A
MWGKHNGSGKKKVGIMKIESQKFLLFTARSSIAKRIAPDWKGYKNYEQVDYDDEEIHKVQGTFVTLTIGGNLRGCIGQIIPDEPIVDTIRDNALSSAFSDPRFNPMQQGEFSKIDIEISILTYPQSVQYKNIGELLDVLEQNVHGVILRKGFHSATFLPQVWEDLPSKEEFLSHLSIKAGLGNDAWRKGDLAVQVYTVEHFNESILKLKVW